MVARPRDGTMKSWDRAIGHAPATQATPVSVVVLSQDQQDTICLTDIAKFKNPDHPDDAIRNWLRSRNTVEFLGVWERLNNPSVNPVEFDGIRMQTGLHSFVLTPKQWIQKTGAVGLTSSAGRYGGTFAHKDIAFEFASWVSVEFKLYLIKEFQRLKEDESRRMTPFSLFHQTQDTTGGARVNTVLVTHGQTK